MSKVKMFLSVDQASFKKKFGRLTPDIVDHARVRMEKLAKQAWQMIKDLTPSTKSGTDIKGMWKLDISRQGQIESYLVENIYPNQDIIEIFEVGAQRHIIQPSKKMMLAWDDQRTGETIFAKSVAHPGMKGHHMVAQTWAAIAPLIAAYEKMTLQSADKVMKG